MRYFTAGSPGLGTRHKVQQGGGGPYTASLDVVSLQQLSGSIMLQQMHDDAWKRDGHHTAPPWMGKALQHAAILLTDSFQHHYSRDSKIPTWRVPAQLAPLSTISLHHPQGLSYLEMDWSRPLGNGPYRTRASPSS